jgi:gluconate 2-dehydrogenase gamma chain
MSTRPRTRRSFIVSSATGLSTAWLAAHWPAIVEAREYASQAGPATKFQFFTQQQAADVEAITAQIIPTDSTPGAREARCVNFIDRLLATREKERQAAYAQGLKDVQAKAAELVPGAASFAALTSAQQIQVLTALEKSPFFTMVRNDTILGMFSDPKHGGNYNQVGWKLIGYNPSLKFPYENKAPFGYYDARIS